MISRLFTLLGASNPKRYLKSTLWIFVTKIISIGVSLAATFYIARTLGPQNFGELNYALSIVNMLAFFGAIASGTVICRDLVKNKTDQQTILGTAWVLTMAGTLITVLGVFALVLILPHDHITLYIVGILCLAQICSPFSVVHNIFYANADTKRLSLTQLSIHIIISLTKIVAMTQDQGVLVLASIMFFEQLLNAIVMVVIYKRYSNIRILTWKFDSSYAKRLALDSIPFIFISMSVVVSGRVDQVFLKHFIDVTAVGLYSVAVQLTEIWQVAPQLLLAALLPALVNAHTTGSAYGRRIVALVSLFAIYSLLISLATYFLAPTLVPLIYGEAFLLSIPILQIYTWSLFGIISGFLVTSILVTENQRRIQIVVGVIPMLINIILNLLFIPEYGAAGAAWATVISYSTAPLIPFLFSSIRHKFQTQIMA